MIPVQDHRRVYHEVRYMARMRNINIHIVTQASVLPRYHAFKDALRICSEPGPCKQSYAFTSPTLPTYAPQYHALNRSFHASASRTIRCYSTIYGKSSPIFASNVNQAFLFRFLSCDLSTHFRLGVLVRTRTFEIYPRRSSAIWPKQSQNKNPPVSPFPSRSDGRAAEHKSTVEQKQRLSDELIMNVNRRTHVVV